jgi:pyruvate/2-oxoglutarate dehydrogenase complex dihydrolipoamide dehydrogenase (E3) component
MAKSKHYNYPVTIMATTGHIRPSDDDGRRGARPKDVEVAVNFPRIMERMHKLRLRVASVDGHACKSSLGTEIFQGRGIFISPNLIEVVEYGREASDPVNLMLTFKNVVIAMGDRSLGLIEASYTTNVGLFRCGASLGGPLCVIINLTISLFPGTFLHTMSS